MHDLVIELDLSHRLEELLLSLFVHPLVVEEVLGDALEESKRVVVVTFAWAPVVYAVYQAHISLFRQLYVNQILNQLKSIWLRKLLQDEGSLLLILAQHLSEKATAHDADDWLGLAVFFKQ